MNAIEFKFDNDSVRDCSKLLVCILYPSLGKEAQQSLLDCTKKFANDSYYTYASVLHSKESVAIACIWMSAKILRLPFLLKLEDQVEKSTAENTPSPIEKAKQKNYEEVLNPEYDW